MGPIIRGPYNLGLFFPGVLYPLRASQRQLLNSFPSLSRPIRHLSWSSLSIFSSPPAYVFFRNREVFLFTKILARLCRKLGLIVIKTSEVYRRKEEESEDKLMSVLAFLTPSPFFQPSCLVSPPHSSSPLSSSLLTSPSFFLLCFIHLHDDDDLWNCHIGASFFDPALRLPRGLPGPF